MNSPTQQEIAEQLGVSVATVSRALRNISSTKSSTAVRIIEAARAMGYRLPATEASVSRRALAQQKLTVLGFLLCMPDRRTPNNTEILFRILHGATDAAKERGVLLHTEYISEKEAEQIVSVSDVPPSLRKPQIAGVLMAGLIPTRAADAMAKKKPCVLMNVHNPGSRIDFVGQDNLSAVSELIASLKAAGHRKIGYYCEHPEASFALSRFSGYVETLARERLEYIPSCSINIWKREPGRAMDRIVEEVRRGVRAWICAHDDLGYNLITRLQKDGFSVPGDVSVCGFDHLHPPEGMVPLTTIDWPLEDMAAAEIGMLLRRINNPARAVEQLLFSGRFIDGQSVGLKSGT
jgi:DNA-binding LacI/PurR family transcriptional regulator